MKRDDIVEKYKDRKGTSIWIRKNYDGTLVIDVTVIEKGKGSRGDRTWGDEFMETLDYITPSLSDYSYILYLLRNDKPARRWFKKKALGMRLYKYTLSDFIDSHGQIDWEKARRLEPAEENGKKI